MAIARLQNAIERVRHRMRLREAGVPRGVLTPLVENDLYVAHQSLWRFYAAFSVRKKVLLLDANAGAAASEVATPSGAQVTAVLPVKTHLDYAVRDLGGDNVEFVPAIPQAQHDVVVVDLASLDSAESALDRVLSGTGLLIVRLTPAEAASTVALSAMSRLRRRFAAALTFAHLANAPLDFGSRETSSARLSDFGFLQLDAQPMPANTITIIHVLSNDRRWADLRLQLGAGPLALPDWINIDNQPYEGVNFLWDLAEGLPFRGAQFIFAEHFIEHLAYDDAGSLLRQCRAALAPTGVLRLSTPNLDWVWKFSYHLGLWTAEGEAVRDCYVLNRAFRGWGHQFLYNDVTLADVLRSAGFAEIRATQYGVSEHPELRNLERHGLYPDEPAVPHVLVMEASGISQPSPSPYAEYIAEFRRDVAVV